MKSVCVLFCLSVFALKAEAGDQLIFQGYLPGQFEIEGASARPATKSKYLVYACAIDDYLRKNETALKKLGYAYLAVEKQRTSAFETYSSYETHWPSFTPYDSKSLGDLKSVLDSGYSGRFTNELRNAIKELQQKTETIVPANGTSPRR